MFKVKHHILRIGFFALACCTSHSMPGQSLAASSQQAKIVASVETMFQALGTNNKGLFESRISPGFYVYDAGMRFQGDRIFQAVQQFKTAGTTFTWSVTSPDIHVQGRTAWIAYVDKGTKTTATGTVPMEWLESACLVKRGGQWVLEFMQSTPISALPAAS